MQNNVGFWGERVSSSTHQRVRHTQTDKPILSLFIKQEM